MHLDLLPLPRNHLARGRNADLSGGDKCALVKPPPDLLGKGCYLTHLGTQAAASAKKPFIPALPNKKSLWEVWPAWGCPACHFFRLNGCLSDVDTAWRHSNPPLKPFRSWLLKQRGGRENP